LPAHQHTLARPKTDFGLSIHGDFPPYGLSGLYPALMVAVFTIYSRIYPMRKHRSSCLFDKGPIQKRAMGSSTVTLDQFLWQAQPNGTPCPKKGRFTDVGRSKATNLIKKTFYGRDELGTATGSGTFTTGLFAVAKTATPQGQIARGEKWGCPKSRLKDKNRQPARGDAPASGGRIPDPWGGPWLDTPSSAPGSAGKPAW